MIKRLVMLDGIEYTVHRPILTSVVNDLKKSIFKDEDIYTIYLNNLEDSDFDSTKNIYNNEVKNKILEISAEIISNEDMAMTNNVLRNNHNPILLDNDIMFKVMPNTINTVFNITLKYIDHSKSNIVKLLNHLKLTTINDSYYDQHNVEYYYDLPVNLLNLIRNIYTLKTNASTPYYPYLNEIAVDSIDYVNSRTGDYSIPVIRERQPVMGNFETDFFSKNKIDKDDHGWYVELEYKLTIDIPTNLLIEYPILVNNKSIDKKYIPEDKHKHIDLIKGASNVIDALAGITGSYFNDRISNNEAIINFPIADEFTPGISNKPDMFRLISFMCMLDETKLSMLLNLQDIDNIIINKSIIEYMKTRVGNSLFNPYEDIFHFELFENNTLVDKKLFLDNDFNIKSKLPLDITKTYRLVLNTMYNLNDIPYLDGLTTSKLSEYMDILNSINVNGVYNMPNQMYTVMLTYIFSVEK